MLSYSCKLLLLLLFCKLRTPPERAGGGWGRTVCTCGCVGVTYSRRECRLLLSHLSRHSLRPFGSRSATRRGQTRRPGSGRADYLWLGAPSRLQLSPLGSRAEPRPSMSRSAEEGSTFKAPTNLPIPPPFTLQAKRSAADAYCRTKHSTARRGRRARCAHKRKALCLIAAPGGAGLVPTLLELYLFAAIFFLRIFPPFGCATQQL